MVAINRIPGKALIESMMIDTIQVTRPARGPGAKALNEATGKMETIEAATSIYTGYALLATIRNKDKEMTIGDAPIDLNGYELLLPRSTASAKVLTGDPNAIRNGDLVLVTSGAENPAIAGGILKVAQTERSTHPVYTRVTVRQENSSPDNPEF